MNDIHVCRGKQSYPQRMEGKKAKAKEKKGFNWGPKGINGDSKPELLSVDLGGKDQKGGKLFWGGGGKGHRRGGRKAKGPSRLEPFPKTG